MNKVITEEKTKTIAGACRRIVVSNRDKTRIVALCDYCHHLAEMSVEKKCKCCGHQITLHQNYGTLKSRFEEIIQDNQGFMEGFQKIPSKQENRFYAWVKIGLWTYKIDMRYFIEYMDLAFADGEEKYDKFFGFIEKNCPRIIL